MAAAAVASLYLGSMYETSGMLKVYDIPRIVFYAMVFVGSPLLSFAQGVPAAGIHLAALAGLSGILLLVLLVTRIRRSGSDNWRFWSALGCISIFAGLLAGAGRSSFGAEQALALRYIPFSSLLWISIDTH